MNKLSHLAFAILCISASVWFIRNDNVTTPDQSIPANKPTQLSDSNTSSENPQPSAVTIRDNSPRSDLIIDKISSYLKKQQFSNAVDAFNYEYADLDEFNIQRIQNLFTQTAQQYLSQKQTSIASKLMTEYLNAIQDEQAYLLLARVQAMEKKFRPAIDSGISAYGLSNGARQKKIEQYIVNIALDFYNKELENYRSQGIQDSSIHQDGRFSDVLQTLNQLHYLFPENTRLTFETAKLLTLTGDLLTAKQYLSSLTYSNNKYTQAAKSQLRIIEESQTTALSRANQKKKTFDHTSPSDANQVSNTPSNSIVIPLQRSGSSYLVDVVINQSPVTLLLDTGASITALSEKSIDNLNLDKTSQRIRLSTANGTRSSHIYRADSLQLNDITLKKVAIVEIELGQKSKIDGLLGTDILQQFNYQIDNSIHSLILTPR